MLKRALRPVAAIACAFTIAVLSGCMAAENNEDITTVRNVDPGTGQPTTPWRQFIRLNSPSEFTQRLLDDAEDNCGVAPTDPEWGDPGSSEDALVNGHVHVTFDALDDDFVTCMWDEIRDDPEDEDPEERRFVICEDIHDGGPGDEVRDCRTEDSTGDPNAITDASQFFRASMADKADVEQLLVLIRDQDLEDSQPGGGLSCMSVAGRRCVGASGTFTQANPACIAVFGATETSVIAANNGRTTEWIQGCPVEQ